MGLPIKVASELALMNWSVLVDQEVLGSIPGTFNFFSGEPALCSLSAHLEIK